MRDWFKVPVSIRVSVNEICLGAREPVTTAIVRGMDNPVFKDAEPSSLWLKALDQSIAGALASVRQPAVESEFPRIRELEVVFSDELCRLWLTPPPVNATEPGDCVAASVLRFESLFGLRADRWRIVADLDANRSFLSAALPRALVDCVCAALMSHGVRPASIRPAFVGTWSRVRREMSAGDWLAVVAPHSVTVARAGPLNWWSSGQSPDLVRILPRPEVSALSAGVGGGSDWLAQAIRLEALRQDLPVPQRVLLCGEQLPDAAKASAAKTSAAKTSDDLMRFERLQKVEP